MKWSEEILTLFFIFQWKKYSLPSPQLILPSVQLILSSSIKQRTTHHEIPTFLFSLISSSSSEQTCNKNLKSIPPYNLTSLDITMFTFIVIQNFLKRVFFIQCSYLFLLLSSIFFSELSAIWFLFTASLTKLLPRWLALFHCTN